jgi:hypothetical protein
MLIKSSLVASCAAFAAGLGVGYVDSHATEVVVTLTLTLVVNLLLGVIRTKGAWKYPLAVALGAACWVWFAMPATPNFPHTFQSFAELTGVLTAAGVVGVGAVYAFRQLPRAVFR